MLNDGWDSGRISAMLIITRHSDAGGICLMMNVEFFYALLKIEL